MTPAFSSDIARAKELLGTLPCDWDGKKSVLELKDANYNWRQMEWWAFYFEYLCYQRLGSDFQIPGDTIGTVRFDLKRSTNWDLKAKAIKSDQHTCILNDKAATDQSVKLHTEHGVMIALCDVEYNDVDRSFQKWHSRLKGGLSKYEHARRKRTQVSRYRKTRAMLREILFLRLDLSVLDNLGEMRQGRNSNDRPRPVKYTVDLEHMEGLIVDRLRFPAVQASDD